MKKFARFYYSCSFNVCLWALLSLIGIMFLSPSAFAQQSGDFYYTVNADNTVTITGYNCPGGPVVIPDTIDSKPVVGIGVMAFANCYGLTSVTIPTALRALDCGVCILYRFDQRYHRKQRCEYWGWCVL